MTLRHVAPAEAKCSNACEAAGHWLVELRTAVRRADPKPVTLAMTQGAELEKELRAAAASTAKKVEGATAADSILLIRVPAQAPFGLVQSLVSTVASSGIHWVEFAVASGRGGATERSLPVPLPVDQGARFVETDARAKLEEIRIAMSIDQARSEVRVQFGKNLMPPGVEGEARLRTILTAAATDLARLGIQESSVVIDAASGVPWQAIVGVIDVVRGVAVKDMQFDLQFATPAAKK
ncbi:MAG: hypothetical protein Q7T30_00650 [Planctomycetota bacterium]|nr:hypothetical protein [Planctomycetota bacterium]